MKTVVIIKSGKKEMCVCVCLCVFVCVCVCLCVLDVYFTKYGFLFLLL